MNYAGFILISVITIVSVTVILLKRLRKEENKSVLLIEIEDCTLYYKKKVNVIISNHEDFLQNVKRSGCHTFKSSVDIALIPQGMIFFIQSKETTDFERVDICTLAFQIWFPPLQNNNKRLRGISQKYFREGKVVRSIYERSVIMKIATDNIAPIYIYFYDLTAAEYHKFMGEIQKKKSVSGPVSDNVS